MERTPIGTAIIRDATARDIAAMQDIEVDAGGRFAEAGLPQIAADPPPTAAELSPYVRSGTAWIAIDESRQPMGYALGSVVDDHAHLDQVSVARRAQGLGVGRALIERVARWGNHHGLGAITLTTFRDIPFNGPLYAHLGFSELAPDEWGPELAAIRAAERSAGLDLAPRIAMRRVISLQP